jgi:hypothetical protein
MKVSAGSTEHCNTPCSHSLSLLSFWSMGSVFCLTNISQLPLLFQFAISWGPHIVVQWTLVNIGILFVSFIYKCAGKFCFSILQLVLGFHLLCLKQVLKMLSISPQAHITSKKQFAHCVLTYFWQNWKLHPNCVFKIQVGWGLLL